ncbi:MAG: hypothetical protein KDA22_08530 [Phycisphaerales bacterium]|nr:hypothetical protein [Phycisphaerales bacterium]
MPTGVARHLTLRIAALLGGGLVASVACAWLCMFAQYGRLDPTPELADSARYATSVSVPIVRDLLNEYDVEDLDVVESARRFGAGRDEFGWPDVVAVAYSIHAGWPAPCLVGAEIYGWPLGDLDATISSGLWFIIPLAPGGVGRFGEAPPFSLWKGLTLPVRPMWRGLLLDCLFFGAAIGLVRSALVLGRARVRRARGRCPACGYVLMGSPRCPECGWPDTSERGA